MASSDWLKELEGFEVLEGSAGMVGIATGIGAALLAPILVPLLSQVGKPILKAVVKEGILLYEQGREAFAEVADAWEDIVAEAQYEVSQLHQTTANPSNTPPHNIAAED